MSHIFVSYSHEDSDYAHNLAKALESYHFDAWIDDRIDYGAAWPRVIQEKVDSCDAFVLVMTPRAYESDWVQNELARAQEKKRPIFPVLLEGDGPWIAVQAIQYIDVRGGKLPPVDFYQVLASKTHEQKIQRGEKLPLTVRLSRIRQGRDLVAFVSEGHGHHISYDEPQDEMELKSIGDFCALIDDWEDIACWGDSKSKIETEFLFTQKIKELESIGLHVYAGRTKGDFNTPLGPVKDWQVTIITIAKRDLEFLLWFHVSDD